jgi:hypothetical protein
MEVSFLTGNVLNRLLKLKSDRVSEDGSVTAFNPIGKLTVPG